jgi:hypothetical protein
MSGPIVRKYGFPNFDAIFGKKELAHGVDEPVAEGSGEAGAADSKEPEKASEPPAPRSKPNKK